MGKRQTRRSISVRGTTDLIRAASAVAGALVDGEGAIAAWCGTWHGLGIGHGPSEWISRMQAAREFAAHEDNPGTVSLRADMTIAVVCVENVTPDVIDRDEDGGVSHQPEGICVVTVWRRDVAPSGEDNAVRVYNCVAKALEKVEK